MHDPPTLSSGTVQTPLRQHKKRPIPQTVRETIRLMVYGRDDDLDCQPLSFIEAAKLAGVAPDVFRRYLDRGDVRALLLSERRAFRAAI